MQRVKGPAWPFAQSRVHEVAGAWDAFWQQGSASQFPLSLYVMTIDILVALVGAILIGIYLGVWLLPWIVDRLERVRLPDATWRYRRNRRGR